MNTFKATRSFLVFLLALCTPCIGSAKSTSSKIKDTIDEVSDSLKKDVDKIGDNLAALQDHLDHYEWKGVIQGEATSGACTLSDFKMNERHRAVVVKPGEIIDADVTCYLDPQKSSAVEIYRVVIGFKKLGPQTTICNCLGISSGKKLENFNLIAPTEPGFYEVRFRTVNKVLESNAIAAWTDEKGEEPDSSTTIGIVWVKS